MVNYIQIDSTLSDTSIAEFNKLKNNIFLMLKNQESMKSILIVSSHYNEGSSSVARNLSRVIAEESHQKVLMVDLRFDVALSKHSKVRHPGLSDYILNDYPLESVMMQTNIQNLFLLSPGRAECNPLSIITSPKFSELMDEVKKKTSCIIIDAPPVQYCPESTVLASKVDKVILIVQAEKTKREVALDTKRKLEAVHANILGIVFNKKKHYIPHSIYKLF
ncbi:MAG: hypothetical protein AMK70_00610 [Nitrospira bacterium SG8_35_1]|nr:MAG: hypothetical protein AMK70_00610 [Nitrospira bacterium SG8_35_1]